MAVETLSLLACQISVPQVRGSRAKHAHVTRIATQLDAYLAEERADLVVLPELSTIDYSRAAFANLDVLAEELDGPSVQAFGALAEKYKTTVVFGMPRREGSGFRISQIVLGPDGNVLGYYDKIHICQYGASMEKDYFERGTSLCTFTVVGVKVAPIICYDIRIPELTRSLTLEHSVDLVLHCGAYARDPSFFSWHHFAMTRALENQVFLLSLNRAGAEWGGSAFYPPWVDETTRETVFGDEEVFKRITIDLKDLERARQTYTFRSDRLPRYDTLPLISNRLKK